MARSVGVIALLCVVILPGCGGTPKKSAEARFVALTNTLCREEQSPGFQARRPSTLRNEQEEFQALVGAARTSRRAASYLADIEGQEDDTYQLRVKTYADEKALGLTSCLGPPPRNPKCGTRKPGPSRVLTLLPADVRHTVTILHENSALAHLLHGVGYRLAHKGPWSTGGEENCLVGAIVWLRLGHPIEISAKLPEAVYEPNIFPPYIERRRLVRVPAVEELIVEVDLVRGVVVGIKPS